MILLQNHLQPLSGNNKLTVIESRKPLKIQGFPGLLFFTGYKLATSGRFSVAIIFCGYGIKLSGYFGLLVRVQMAVGFHGGLHPFVSQAFCYQKRRTVHVNQQTGVGMPLRYNYDKPEKPRRIKGFEVFSLVFSSFSKPKNHIEISRIIGGVSLTTNE